MKESISSQLYKHWILSIVLFFADLVGQFANRQKKILNGILMLVYFVTGDVEQLFMYLLAVF